MVGSAENLSEAASASFRVWITQQINVLVYDKERELEKILTSNVNSTEEEKRNLNSGLTCVAANLLQR